MDSATQSETLPFDALLVVSFGGPEGPDDVMPFLENVVRGKDVPRQRLLQVAEHYELFGGVSPLNSQNRALLTALATEFHAHKLRLPIYWGNRNWHPMLADAVAQMAEDGIKHALAFVTSAFGSYSGCRQYVEDIERAREEVGPDAPQIEKLRLFYNHPGFIEATADRVATAWREIPDQRRDGTLLLFTAHSIPHAAAACSPYERQLREACRLAAELVASGQWAVASGQTAEGRREGGEGREDAESPNLQISKSSNSNPQSLIPNPLGTCPRPNPLPKGEGTTQARACARPWELVFQSRSGSAAQSWLEPDIHDRIRRLPAEGVEQIVVAPIGFLAENMEVIYDIDVEVAELCDELGINMVRAGVVANHPRLVQMVRELVVERLDPASPRLALGPDGPWPDQCPAACCRSA
jgi:protoporphyrin/coproporphyrin ferrochelatase